MKLRGCFASVSALSKVELSDLLVFEKLGSRSLKGYPSGLKNIGEVGGVEHAKRLLDEMHSRQRGIDAIDHMLHRVSCECTSRRVCAEGAQERDAEAACAEEDTGCSGEGEVGARG